MHLPYFLRHVNRVFTNHLFGTVAWLVPPLAVIHHVGRKTRRPYRTPVAAFPSASGSGFVIPMTYGRDVDWGRNMLAADGCELERAGKRLRLRRPRIVGLDVAERHLPAVTRRFFRTLNLPGFVLLEDDR